MTLKAVLPGLGNLFKGDATVKRYYVQGGGEVSLSKSDFKAQGGEGSVYVRGAHAYKIYTDIRRAIPPAKIRELSALSLPNIVRPLELLLDARMRAAGYSMRAVGRSYALCQLFPKAFRQRNNLTPETTLRLVLKMREGVSHVHSKGVLVVDLNEMNFLVAEDFSEVYFIDVDSYQTPSFPAAALMESVRDRHAREFSTASDWFSFAVVSFQTFVGIHPYKGSYPPMQGSGDKAQTLDARMRANVSVLRPGVKVPASCLPFGVIPPAYLDWYRAIFEEGKRLPPPGEAHAAIVTAALAAPAPSSCDGGSPFEFTLVGEFDDEVVFHDGALTVTRSSVYFGGGRLAKPRADAHVVLTPRLRHAVAAYVEDGAPRLRDLTAGRDLPLSIGGEEMAVCGGRLYVKQGESVFAVEFLELGKKISPVVSTAANVMMKSTRMFEGLAAQNLLGAHYASVFPAPGVCHQIRLPELDGYQLLDARLCRNVLLAVGARGGRYDRLVFRFADDFGSYDSRVVGDASSTDINFAVLDTGVVLSLTDEGALELFPRRKGARDFKTFDEPGVGADARLFQVGAQAYVARGPKLYKFNMRRSP
ncbi:MAG TPA: hypothetical protein VNZ44_11210 [Pyrinomonadaceae bacterium]|nr:hypothetical protein [Pyrinomonadaceae bacterium]